MRKFSMRFLRPKSAWNLWRPLKLMFASLVLSLASVFSLCVTCFLINIHKEECHTQQLAGNVHLKVYLNVALTLLLIHE